MQIGMVVTTQINNIARDSQGHAKIETNAQLEEGQEGWIASDRATKTSQRDKPKSIGGISSTQNFRTSEIPSDTGQATKTIETPIARQQVASGIDTGRQVRTESSYIFDAPAAPTEEENIRQNAHHQEDLHDAQESYG